MIVISAGMQKAGTGWYFNLTNDLLVSAGHQDARFIRDKYELSDMLLHHNCNIAELSPSNLRRLEVLCHAGFTFAVKTHSGPTNALLELVRKGIFKITYIYRDPRDVAISAFEHGNRLRLMGRKDSFARLKNVESAILFANDTLGVWNQYRQLNHVLFCRYEDLVFNPKREMIKLMDFLDIKLASSELDEIIESYSRNQILNNKKMQGFLHYNKGVSGRFKHQLTPDNLALCNQYFGQYLQRMGYTE
jgi:hypothetical protein